MDAAQRQQPILHVPDQAGDATDPASTDPAMELVKRWPRLRTAKTVWRRLWVLNGCKPGSMTVSVEEYGRAEAVCRRRSGEHHLESLEEERLIQGDGPGGEIVKNKGRWTFLLVHPRIALSKLRAIRGDPQGQLDFPAEPEEAALAPALAPAEIDSKEEIQIPICAGASAGASAENRPDPGPAYFSTVDELVALWLETCSARVGQRGARRDTAASIKPQVQQTLGDGFTPAEIAKEMRARRDKSEYYNQFHSRLLREYPMRGTQKSRPKTAEQISQLQREKEHKEKFDTESPEAKAARLRLVDCNMLQVGAITQAEFDRREQERSGNH